MKKLTAALALLLAAACASTPMTSSSTTASGARIDATDYVLLSAPEVVRPIDDSTNVYQLHIRGAMTNRGFYPVGGVQGRGELCTNGQDWLSLSDLKVHKAGEGSPQAPYLLGCIAGKSFKPASRDIVMQ